ncbi:transposase [Erwinia tracheiphila PSU-1]|nr:transposase [Erwinia tracheiphila PSU-1]
MPVKPRTSWPVAGRTHSRMNRFRRPLTRREKTPENDGGLLCFSCGLIVWNNVLLRQALRQQAS